MLNKRGKIVVGIIVLVASVVSLYLLYNIILTLKSGTVISSSQVISNINSSNDYNVYLNDNNFITNEYLPSESSYVSSLVKYIEAKFKYQYIDNKNSVIKYNYNITAKIDSKYNGDSSSDVSHSIWNKTFILKSSEEQTIIDGKFTIDETQNVDLPYYDTLVKLFKEQLNISVESTLDVRMTINIRDGSVQKEHYMSMVIPLDVKSFDILKYKNFSEKEVFDNNSNNSEQKYVLAIIYIILLIVILGCSTHLVLMILNLNKTKYKKEIDKILNNYGNRIINVSSFMDYDNYETVDLLNFEEMLNLADETFEPIVYWEKSVGKESWFSILRNNILYRYIIANKK
jgi:hypothetical protein